MKVIFLQLILAEMTIVSFLITYLPSSVCKRFILIFFSRNIRSVSTKRDTKQYCVKGIQVFKKPLTPFSKGRTLG